MGISNVSHCFTQSLKSLQLIQLSTSPRRSTQCRTARLGRVATCTTEVPSKGWFYHQKLCDCSRDMNADIEWCMYVYMYIYIYIILYVCIYLHIELLNQHSTNILSRVGISSNLIAQQSSFALGFFNGKSSRVRAKASLLQEGEALQNLPPERQYLGDLSNSQVRMRGCSHGGP